MMEEYNINQTTLKILGPYRSDYRRSLHLGQMARETRVDVKAVQLQLKRLERMRILSSVRKGRSKGYSVNLRDSIAMYYLMRDIWPDCTTIETNCTTIEENHTYDWRGSATW